MARDESINRQLPSNLTAEEFGEVNIRRVGNKLHVLFTILMAPEGAEAEGWQTGVALDASASMKEWYGRRLSGEIPESVTGEFIRKGWITERTVDGQTVHSLTAQAVTEAKRRGYIRDSDNIVEPIAQEFIAYLAENLDADGGTTVIYWACGKGDEYEVIGDYTAAQCRTLPLGGPKQVAFGTGTYLTPCMRYFVDRFDDASRGMYVFLTDGRLDDLPQVKRYTTELARGIASGKRNPVKCVLIGVGDEVDESQMEELDDLDTGTEIDIWDHKIAKEMRSVLEIFAELVNENQIIADSARIFDSSGKMVKNFPDGLPARVSIELPASSTWFELEVGGERIRQTLVVPGR